MDKAVIVDICNFNLVIKNLHCYYLFFKMFDELYQGRTIFTLKMSEGSSLYNVRLTQVKS